MNKPDADTLAELQKMVNDSNKHFSRASQVWNSFGIDNPLLEQDAAQSALEEYQKSADLLDMNKISVLTNGSKNRVMAMKEQALAQVAYMKSQLLSTKSTENLMAVLETCQEGIEHLRRSLEFLRMAEPSDDALELKLKDDLLHAEGIQANLTARLAAREGRFADGIQAYTLAEAKFLDQMKIYESREPELNSIRLRVEKSFDTEWETKDTEYTNNIHFTARTLRTEESVPLLSGEDLYRRAASNYYSSKASRCNLEAHEILQRGEPPEDAENILNDSVKFTYFALEAFPANLEFHRDLLNAWRVKGQMFGCPLIETEKYLETRCPIATKHFIGYWYVSPTLQYDSLVCTICNKDILECSHQPGQKVDGITVRYKRQNVSIESISLVDIPEDPGCRIERISIPKERFPSKPNPNSQWRCYICQREDIEPSIVEDISAE